MLAQVIRLQNGETLPAVSGAEHKAEIDTRLGR
jgi:hypothetical protein